MSDPELVETSGVRQPGGMFRAFGSQNYRLYFFGSFASSVGAWMQSTAMSWIVLTELTDGDAGAMGLTVALQFIPSLLLIPVVGRVVDRFDRRTMLFVTSGVLACLAAANGVLLVLHVLTLPMMYGFAVIWGVLAAFDMPLRQAFFGDIVVREHLVNAVSLGSVQFNVARLTGPALAGVLIAAVGSGWLFVINSGAFVLFVGALAVMRRSEFLPRHEGTPSGGISVAVRYVRRRSDLLLLLGTILLSSAFAAQFPVYAAAMAVDYHEPSWAFGLLTSCYAVGSLTGAVLMARVRVARMRRIVTFAFAVALTTAISALMPDFWAYAAVAAVCGYAIITLMATANAYTQTHTDPAVRGRVLVLHAAFMTGGAPFGAPLIGWAANAWGPRGAVLLVAGAALVVALAGLSWFVITGRVRRASGRRFGIAIDATRPITLPSAAE